MPTIADPQFLASLHFILNEEGGWSDNPRDPGGATMHGITQMSYNSYRRSEGEPTQSVKFISDYEIKNIYFQYYYKPSLAYTCAYGLGLVLFDNDVQFSPLTSLNFILQTLGLQSPTKLTYAQLVGLLRGKDQQKMALSIIDERIAFRHAHVIQDPSQHVFLNGWLARDQRLRTEVLNPHFRDGLLHSVEETFKEVMDKLEGKE